MNADARQLTRDLAKALGLPANTRKAVLTLEAGELPTMQLTLLVLDAGGAPVVEEVPSYPCATMPKRIAQVQFMVRLAPFPPLP